MTASETALPRLDRFRPRGTVRGSRRGRIRALVLVGVHLLFVAHLAHWWTSGSTVTPVEPSESMEAIELGRLNVGLVLFVATIALTLVFGRLFCGWACHFVAYQDAAAWLLARIGLRPRPVRSRLLVLIPFGAAFYMFLWPTLARAWRGTPAPDYRWETTTAYFWDTFPGVWFALLTIAVDGFLLVWWLGAKGFCTYGCPYGALFATVEPLAPRRIRVTDACQHCGHCTAVCTSNVLVHKEVAQHGMVVDPACMKCLDCVSACPSDALYYGFGAPAPVKGFRRLVQRWQASRGDFSWGEEVALAALFVGGLAAWWGAYGLVPFLLALGLGVITAVAGITLWRLWRRPDFAFQHHALRRGRRWTRGGVVATIGIAVWLAFTAHTGAVRHYASRGEELATASYAQDGSAQARRATLEQSRDALETALRIGWFDDAVSRHTLGLVTRELGDFDAAERHLRRAVELRRKGWFAAAIPLADIVGPVRGDWAAAAALIDEVLAERPDYAPALRRRERLDGR